ncbi:MAG: DUF6166 domain-containing protein [Bacillota bacterium]|nr:DUF6166 domain-containing protein [Bacillota bacterium]
MEEQQVMVNGRPLRHVVLHSPTGFSWGYGGSGPADLALSILADFLGDRKLAEQLHQDFKWEFVAKWTEDRPWLLTGAQILAWLRRLGGPTFLGRRFEQLDLSRTDGAEPEEVVYQGRPAGWRPEGRRAAPRA